MKLPPHLPRPPVAGYRRAGRPIMILGLCAFFAFMDIGFEYPNVEIERSIDHRFFYQYSPAFTEPTGDQMLTESPALAAPELASSRVIGALGKRAPHH